MSKIDVLSVISVTNMLISSSFDLLSSYLLSPI